MMTQKKNFIIPLVFVGMMFFAIGFALGINSFLIPVLKGTLGVSSGESYLILAATFSTFIIFGYPASMTISKIGYKRTMALSFLLFAIAFALFIPSAKSESFILFLVASFMSGIGNTFLQASVNPYITILGPIESAAKRMSIMGICNKLAWPVAPVFLAYVIGKNTTDTLISDLYLPFYIIIGVFLLLGIISLLAPLPEVKAVGEDGSSTDESLYASNKKSIWQFPHLLLGALTLFLYVGVETVALSTLVDYADSLALPNASSYAWISSVGMVVGYICGIIFIPKYLSQAKALVICSLLGIAGALLVVLMPAAISIWFIGLMALGCSLMWPALWPLAIADLGKFTKAGSSLLVMAIVGGAVIPTIFGFLKDIVGAQNSYWIALPCFLFILYYGVSGYKIRTT
ncbi:MAG: glucose/galactose MFS transporter [Bacteroidetes bacterium GWF2_40_14]|nr:MAG: glucose/galactose MFS transporter [Bacteroidetes bacterium GWF2_40_14]